MVATRFLDMFLMLCQLSSHVCNTLFMFAHREAKAGLMKELERAEMQPSINMLKDSLVYPAHQREVSRNANRVHWRLFKVLYAMRI